MNIWTSRLLTLTVAAAVLSACSGEKTAPPPPQAPAQNAATPAKKAAQAPNKPAPKKPAQKKAAPPKPAPLQVATSWEFGKLEKPMWEWDFSAHGVQQNGRGAFYTRKKSAPGPRLTGKNFKSSDVKGIRIEVELYHRAEGQEKAELVKHTEAPILYWANTTQISDGDEWPFEATRNARMKPAAGKNKNTFDVRLDGRKAWTGEIADMFFSIPVPKPLGEDENPYGVLIRRIQFLK